jgi:hypothetical protein
MGIDAKLVRKTLLEGIKVLNDNDQKRIQNQRSGKTGLNNLSNNVNQASYTANSLSYACSNMLRLCTCGLVRV